MLDSKLVAKLPTFTGDKAMWKRWSFKVSGHIGQQAPALALVVEGLGIHADPVEHRAMSQEEITLDRGFFYLLTLLLDDIALDELMGLAKGHGLEWWRVNVRRHEPQTGGTQRVKFIHIINPDRDPTLASVTDYFSKLALWESKICEFDRHAPTGSEVSDDVKMATFQAAICPQDLQDHLNLNSDKSTSYQSMRREVERILVRRGTTDSSTISEVVVRRPRKAVAEKAAASSRRLRVSLAAENLGVAPQDRK